MRWSRLFPNRPDSILLIWNYLLNSIRCTANILFAKSGFNLFDAAFDHSYQTQNTSHETKKRLHVCLYCKAIIRMSIFNSLINDHKTSNFRRPKESFLRNFSCSLSNKKGVTIILFDWDWCPCPISKVPERLFSREWIKIKRIEAWKSFLDILQFGFFSYSRSSGTREHPSSLS